jgi:ATP-dependent Clp protease adaptor protein ClpS
MNEDLPCTIVTTRPKTRQVEKTRRLPPYNVILVNDDYHSFEFVLGVLQKTFGYSAEKAFLLTHEAHTQGRAIVWTGSKEVAELKAEQIQSFPEIRDDGRKLGPLGCCIEPAPGG